MSKVTFDGNNKLIICNSGSTELNVKVDLYSDWKEWILLSDNSKYLIAFSTIGGDNLGIGLYAGDYYFLENGWKIRPQESSHILNIAGNLFTRDGSNPFLSTLSSYNVSVRSAFSSLTQIVNSDITSDNIADAVWNESVSTYPSNSAGNILANVSASSGATPIQIANAVWSQNTSSFNDGTFGYEILEILNTTLRLAGQSNFKLSNVTYNPQGNLKTGIVKIYNTREDEIYDNPKSIIYVSASYDSNGKLIEYKSFK